MLTTAGEVRQSAGNDRFDIDLAVRLTFQCVSLTAKIGGHCSIEGSALLRIESPRLVEQILHLVVISVDCCRQPA